MREAEHVRTHTVETTIAQIEHHNKRLLISKGVSCSHQERLNSVRAGVVMSSTSV